MKNLNFHPGKENKKNKNFKKEKGITRREFLKKLGLGTLGVLGTIPILEILRSCESEEEREKTQEEVLNELEQKIKIYEEEQFLDISENKEKKVEVILDENLEKYLSENNLSNLMTIYFGDLEKTEEGNFKISPFKILDNLWKEKINKTNNEEFKKKLIELKINLIKDYQKWQGKKVDLKDFINYINLNVKKSLSALDWEQIKSKFVFSKESSEILNRQKEELFNKIINDKKFEKYLSLTLLVIILNEISFASLKNPDINLQVLNFLISNFGINFISLIPAIYDQRISFGPFQLTDLVVGDEKNKKYFVNDINEFVKESSKKINLKLPDKLEEFRKSHHYQGTVFLCVYYLCSYIKKANEAQTNQIKDTFEKQKEEFYYQLFLMWCACHHGGYSVIGEFLEEERKLKEEVKIYLERSKANLSLVKKFYNLS
jgi:hypothetical protein